MNTRRLPALCLFLALMLVSVGCSRPMQTPKPSPTSPPARTGTQAPPSPSASPQKQETQLVPPTLETAKDGQPLLNVYIHSTGDIQQMPIEEYLEGVLAGEMQNSWPMEALKAQAIIARTFVLKFIEDKGGSMYEGADVSTDTKEAQAYNAEEINERIKQSIAETAGEVITHQGQLTYSWFHSHAGGVTAAAKEGLEWEGDEPPYIRSVDSKESDSAPADVQEWTASFPLSQLQSVLKEMSFNFPSIDTVIVGSIGESGRVTTLSINGTPVTAPSLRVRLGPAEFKSTLLTDVQFDGKTITFTGKGYGHGVGMSQWGAYQMAEDGVTAEDIVQHYYTDVEIQRAWGDDKVETRTPARGRKAFT